jgi:hypothetical protein
LREAMRTPIPYGEGNENALASLRLTLGDTGVAEALQAGKRLTLTQAVLLALEGKEPYANAG